MSNQLGQSSVQRQYGSSCHTLVLLCCAGRACTCTILAPHSLRFPQGEIYENESKKLPVVDELLRETSAANALTIGSLVCKSLPSLFSFSGTCGSHSRIKNWPQKQQTHLYNHS